MKKPNNGFNSRKKRTYQRNFEIELDKDIDANLGYFVRQELAYFNSIIELLTPRLRTFPADLLSMKEREQKLWEVCAEFAVDPNKMITYKLDEWPQNMKPYHGMMYDLKNNLRISSAHLNILQVAASSARIHPLVRKNMANEALKYMMKQADIILTSQKTDVMKTPLQLLNTHTIDTKRHLQIPSSLVKLTYNEEDDSTNVNIPYSKSTICIPNADLTESRFNLLVIRNTTPKDRIWNIELKEHESKYLLNLFDYSDKRKPK